MHTVLQYISNIRATLISSLFRNCIEFLVFDEYWISLTVVCMFICCTYDIRSRSLEKDFHRSIDQIDALGRLLEQIFPLCKSSEQCI